MVTHGQDEAAQQMDKGEKKKSKKADEDDGHEDHTQRWRKHLNKLKAGEAGGRRCFSYLLVELLQFLQLLLLVLLQLLHLLLVLHGHLRTRTGTGSDQPKDEAKPAKPIATSGLQLTRFLSSRNFLVLLLLSSRTRRSRSALFLMLLSWLMALLFSMDILAWLARISLLCLHSSNGDCFGKNASYVTYLNLQPTGFRLKSRFLQPFCNAYSVLSQSRVPTEEQNPAGPSRNILTLPPFRTRN